VDYLLHIAVLVLIYAVLGLSLNILLGCSGLVSLGHALFYAVGAYASALVTGRFGLPFGAGLFVGVVAAAVLATAIGICTTRTKTADLIMATLALQVIGFSLLNNLTAFTGGPAGIVGIPRPSILGWRVTSQAAFLALYLPVLFALFGCSRLVLASPFGRVLRSYREDETFTEAAGKRLAVFKVVAIAVSAGMAAVAGSMYAHYISFISPAYFTVMESIFIVSIVIIGGAGSLRGPVVGAIVLVSLPELLRLAGIPSTAAANIRQILYGLALVACMLWRPQGLIGEYAFGREAKPK
jgi:branched-chain amino acid transport system permease protein